MKSRVSFPLKTGIGGLSFISRLAGRFETSLGNMVGIRVGPLVGLKELILLGRKDKKIMKDIIRMPDSASPPPEILALTQFYLAVVRPQIEAKINSPDSETSNIIIENEPTGDRTDNNNK